MIESSTCSNGVKLVIGLFGGELSLIEKAKENLERKFGKVDYESSPLAFTKTDYYQTEMGKNLKRKFYAFKSLVSPELLPDIKVFTNHLERKLAGRAGNRRVNIDPGYLSLAKFVLATTKDYSHRLYLKQGIYAEVTLSFKDGSFRAREWTYPDYCQKEFIEIFNQIRKVYKGQVS